MLFAVGNKFPLFSKKSMLPCPNAITWYCQDYRLKGNVNSSFFAHSKKFNTIDSIQKPNISHTRKDANSKKYYVFSIFTLISLPVLKFSFWGLLFTLILIYFLLIFSNTQISLLFLIYFFVIFSLL